MSACCEGIPDSVRMKEMCKRLIDVIAATSDRDRVKILVGHFMSVRMTELDMQNHESDIADEYWSDDPEDFEGNMKRAEDALSNDRGTTYNHCQSCGERVPTMSLLSVDRNDGTGGLMSVCPKCA